MIKEYNDLLTGEKVTLKWSDKREETMDIWLTYVGDKIYYAYPENGYEFEQQKCKELLKYGTAYTVANVDIHGWSTHVYLKEFPGQTFNSVNFANEDVWRENIMAKEGYDPIALGA